MASHGETHHLKAELFFHLHKCLSHFLGLSLHLLRGELRLDPEDHKSQGWWSWCLSTCGLCQQRPSSATLHCPCGVWVTDLYQANFATKTSSEKTKSTC